MWKQIWKSCPVKYFRKVDELQSISISKWCFHALKPCQILHSVFQQFFIAYCDSQKLILLFKESLWKIFLEFAIFWSISMQYKILLRQNTRWRLFKCLYQQVSETRSLSFIISFGICLNHKRWAILLCNCQLYCVVTPFCSIFCRSNTNNEFRLIVELISDCLEGEFEDM